MTAGHLAWRDLQLLAQRAFPASAGREQACRRRTREPVESLDTLVHTPGRIRTWPGAPDRRRAVAPRRRGRARARPLPPARASRRRRLRRGVARARRAAAPRGRGQADPAGGRGPIDGERASREALASARLAHPAIVALYEACAERGRLLPDLRAGRTGDTLAQLIAAGALADEEVLEIGVALADALAHAHARGVIHRDVKPQNVLVPDHPRRAPTPSASARPSSPTSAARASPARTRSRAPATCSARSPTWRPSRARGARPASRPTSTRWRSSSTRRFAASTRCAARRRPPPRGASAVRSPPLERRRGGSAPCSSPARSTARCALRPTQRGTLEELRLALEEALAARAARARRRVASRPPRGSPTAPRAEPAPRRSHAQRAVTRPCRAADREPRRDAAEQRLSTSTAEAARRRRRLALPRGGCGWACALAADRLAGRATGRPGVALLLLAAPLRCVARCRAGRGAGLADRPRSRRCSAWSAWPAPSPRSPARRARWRERAALARARLLVADARRAAAGAAPVAGRARGHARAGGLGGLAEQRRQRTWSARC